MLEQRAGKFHALANRDDHLGITEPLNELGQIARRHAIADDIVLADQRETFEPVDHILVVIGNNDLHRIASVSRMRCSAQAVHR